MRVFLPFAVAVSLVSLAACNKEAASTSDTTAAAASTTTSTTASAAPAPDADQPRTMEQVVDRITANEQKLYGQIRNYSPLVETYIQNLKPDKDLGQVPAGDRDGDDGQADVTNGRRGMDHIFAIGGSSATLSYSGLAPNFVGLYQFNVVVPNVAASDAVPLTYSLGGVGGTQKLLIAVGN